MNLNHFAAIQGELPKTVGLPWEYFAIRGIHLDCRGPLTIHPESNWGLFVTVLTRSHNISGGPGALGETVERGVVVDRGAWIASKVVLSGCRIGEGSIVAAGAVVNGQNVAPGVIVAGNPARVIARWSEGRWVYLPENQSGFARQLA